VLIIHYHLLLIPLAEVMETDNYHYLRSCTVVLFKAASVRMCTCVCLSVQRLKKTTIQKST